MTPTLIAPIPPVASIVHVTLASLERELLGIVQVRIKVLNKGKRLGCVVVLQLISKRLALVVHTAMA